MIQQSLFVLKWVRVLRKGFSRGTNDPAIPMGPKVGGGGVKEGA